MTATNSVPIVQAFGHKIRPRHLDLWAVVYVRQSTPHQVAENRESADLQYQLQRRAIDLGWSEARVLVIDDDQGCSGQSINNRLGFQRLLAEVSLGHVGIVFGREMSRLARSNKDWYQLLELCALFQVLLADADGVYDPADFNDRLLLGLKGTLSEAELHILKSRLHQGKLNKARRGELFGCVPVGYVRSTDGGIALDPDEQVRSVIQLIFDKFAELGSVSKVHAFFVANDVRIGLRAQRGPERGSLKWHKARRRTLYEVLSHPIYAGAYVHGRTGSGRRVGRVGRITLPPEEWICLQGRVPAYISWEQFEKNRRQMRDNRLYGGNRMTTGKTPTLLNGIVSCSRCGKPMAARNVRATAWPRYRCDGAKHEFGEPLCQSIQAAAVDRLVEGLVLQAVQPAALELSLRAAEGVEQDRQRLHTHWQQKIERAQFEAGRARRQYDAVDPDNRLVVRELERQWEEKLRAVRQLEEDYARFQQAQPQHLSATDSEQIRALAADVPALWHAETTIGADRRAVVRQLIERVNVLRRGESEVIDVLIRWRGGTESRHMAYQGTHRRDQLADYDGLRTRLMELRKQGLTSSEIATILNEEGRRTSRGGPFTGGVTRSLMIRFGLAETPAGAASPEELPGHNEWWLPDLARALSVQIIVMHQWRWAGWIRTRQLRGVHGRVIVWADRSEQRRLRRLRAYQIEHRFQRSEAIPAELTTPKRRPDVDEQGK